MPNEPRKTLRDVYRNIGSGLTLNPDDFWIDLGTKSNESELTDNVPSSSSCESENTESKIPRKNSPTSNENS